MRVCVLVDLSLSTLLHSLSCCLKKKKKTHIGGLEGPIECLDDLLLVRDLVDVFGTADVFLFFVTECEVGV